MSILHHRLRSVQQDDNAIALQGYGFKGFVGALTDTSLSHTTELTFGEFDPNTFIIAGYTTSSALDLSASLVIKDHAAGNTFTTIANLYSNDNNDTSAKFGCRRNADGFTETVFMGHADLDTYKGNCIGFVLGFSNVNQFVPFEVSVVTATGQNTGRPTPGAITPVTAEAKVALVGVANNAAVPSAYTSSDDAAMISEYYNSNPYMQYGLALVPWVSGTLTPAQWGGGSTNAANSWAAISAALRPQRVIYVGGQHGNKAGATSGNSDLTLGSWNGAQGIQGPVQAGDLVVAFFATGSTADRALAISDGTTNYTLIDSERYANGTTYDTNLRVAYKVLTSADTIVRFGPTGNANDAGTYGYLVFRGVNVASPFDVAAVGATGTGTANATPPAITPSTVGSLIVAIGAGAAATTAAMDMDSGFHLRSLPEGGRVGSDVNDSSIAVGLFEWASGTYTPGACTGNSANAADSWAAITLAIRPA